MSHCKKRRKKKTEEFNPTTSSYMAPVALEYSAAYFGNTRADSTQHARKKIHRLNNIYKKKGVDGNSVVLTATMDRQI